MSTVEEGLGGNIKCYQADSEGNYSGCWPAGWDNDYQWGEAGCPEEERREESRAKITPWGNKPVPDRRQRASRARYLLNCLTTASGNRLDRSDRHQHYCPPPAWHEPHPAGTGCAGAQVALSIARYLWLSTLCRRSETWESRHSCPGQWIKLFIQK